MFTIESSDSSTLGRVGHIFTAHGQIETPVFMPVGTLGTVKCLDPEEIRACGFGLILGNAYHLYLRPGHQLIADLLEVEARLDPIGEHLGHRNPALVPEKVGCVQEVDMEPVALDPLPVVDEPAEGAQLVGHRDSGRLFHGVA